MAKMLLSDRCLAQARSMDMEGWYVAANVLASAADNLLPPSQMTPTQFRAAIAKLDLSQERAGLWLGLSARQGQRYANGEAEIPEPVAKLLRLVLRLGLKPEDVQ